MGKETSVLDLAIMIEGQDGINWTRWRRLARAVEDLGFTGLYRSDHFTNPTGPYLDALELWASLTWLADNTSRIEFGPSFRLSRSATQSLLPGRRPLLATSPAVASGSAWAPAGKNANIEPTASSCWTLTAASPVLRRASRL